MRLLHLVLHVGLLLPAAARAQDDELLAAAQQLFAQGQSHYDAGEHREALFDFRASISVYDSPNSRLYVARCLRALGQPIEAAHEYRRTIDGVRELESSSPRYAATRRAAAAELAELSEEIGYVRLRIPGAPPGTEVIIAGRQVSLEELVRTQPVAPGEVEVVVETHDREPVHRTVEVGAGETAVLTVDPARADDEGGEPVRGHDRAASAPPPWLRPAGWTAAAIGGASLVTALGLGVRGRSLRCDVDPCPPDRQDDVDRGRHLRRGARAMLVVGLVATTGAVTLLTIDAVRRGRSVDVAFDGRSLLLRGRF